MNLKNDDDMLLDKNGKSKQHPKKKDDSLDKDFFLRLVNEHHDEIVERNKNKSLGQEEVEYTKKKKIPLKKLRLAIIGGVIVIVMGLTVKALPTIMADDIYVKGRIEYYESMMDSTDKPGPNDHSIEAFVDYNYKDYRDPIVSYKDYWVGDNFFNHIMEASRQENPIVEVRCALIGAYHVINAPYREQEFGKLFNRIINNEEFLNNTGLDGSVESLWQMLGYESFDDFQKNVRHDTIALYKERDDKNGKRM